MGCFFLLKDDDDYYKVSTSLDISSGDIGYLEPDDVFEWNSFFCLTFKNSPHQVNRQPIKIYETIEGLNNQNDDDIVMSEKEEHDGLFFPINAQPILKEFDNSIYKIASLYDNLDENGNYVFLGNYDFGYVKYNEQAHQYYRYVSKREFEEHTKKVLGVTTLTKPNPNPEDLNDIFNNLINLVVESDNWKEGVSGLIEIFESDDVPKGVQEGIFSDPHHQRRDMEGLDSDLRIVYEKMVDHLKNDSNWNQYGYSYIQVEWMD